MRRFLTLFTVLMLSAALASAQTQMVTGRITDENGNPVARASVQEKNSNKGTITDADGNFTLSTTRGKTLVISNVGYERIEVSAGSSPTDGRGRLPHRTPPALTRSLRRHSRTAGAGRPEWLL